MNAELARAYELLEQADRQRRVGELEGAEASLHDAVKMFREHARVNSDFEEVNLPNIEAQYDEIERLCGITEKALAILGDLTEPILQTDLYKKMPDYEDDEIRWAIYYAEKRGDVLRTRKGRSYSVNLTEKGRKK